MANQIILIIIICLIGILLVFGVYFLIIYLHNKKHDKKLDNIFEQKSIVEEDSLLKGMEEKRNFDKPPVTKAEESITIQKEPADKGNDIKKNDGNANPFGVDMTKRNNDNVKIEDNGNKFIKM